AETVPNSARRYKESEPQTALLHCNAGNRGEGESEEATIQGLEFRNPVEGGGVTGNRERINMRMVVALAVLIVLLGLCIRLNQSASQRQSLAELWIGASAQFVATGIANKTLRKGISFLIDTDS
ncbi:MAG: hypothetical protein WB630_23160, partial [Candidatus Acidiferrales bacterium]